MRGIFLILAVGFLNPAVQAEEPADNSVRFELGRDSDGGTFGNLGADFLLNDGLLFVNGGSNRVKRASSGETSITRHFGFGYTFDPFGFFSFTPSVDVWGARTDLASRSLLLDGTFNLQDWSLGLELEGKSLTWTVADPTTRKVRTGAVGASIHVDYVGFKNWQLQFRAGGTSYGGEKFENFVYSYYLTDSAFAASSGLVKNYLSFGLNRKFNSWTVGANYRATNYVVGGARSKSVGVEAGYAINKSWTLGGSWSTARTDGGERFRTVSIHALYSF